ncbi:hypothetical protein B9Q07_01855 [Candidatus Marsarchaeota G2 archaeon ECH_B_3]|uniref:Uncharacterized protein n=2 Tax=Candidatus Marsarchaeota group 2 TaxID=2203771 RepID=A0A2R6BQK1_9ARCH|nr:MAG: hypothetical protein B9Q07_01855 [Candidatus Marsarchaeota G2 archaeon ECH_B_3]
MQNTGGVRIPMWAVYKPGELPSRHPLSTWGRNLEKEKECGILVTHPEKPKPHCGREQMLMGGLPGLFSG